MVILKISDAYPYLAFQKPGERISRGMRALHERRLTAVTAKAVKAATRLVDQNRFEEAALAWDDLYFHGMAFPGRDFHASKRALGWMPMDDGGSAAIRVNPPARLRKGEVVRIGEGITIRVDRIDKIPSREAPFPCLHIEGKKHDCRKDRPLVAPWLRDKPWSRMKVEISF